MTHSDCKIADNCRKGKATTATAETVSARANSFVARPCTFPYYSTFQVPGDITKPEKKPRVSSDIPEKKKEEVAYNNAEGGEEALKT